MKLFFRSIFNIFIILTFLFGCESAVKTNEKDSKALVNQGVAFGKKGQYDRAIAYFDKAIELNPRYANDYYNRGFAYYYKARYDKACSDWKRACELGTCKNHELAKIKSVCE